MSVAGAFAAPSGEELLPASLPTVAETGSLARYTRAKFLVDRQRLAASLRDRDADRTGALFDMAEFHLAHRMVPEGRSMLAALDPDLPPAQARHRTRLELAFRALAETEPPLGERALDALSLTVGEWPDLPVFRLLHLHRADAFAVATPDLRPALDRIPDLSPPLRAAILPALLEVAITSERWAEAREAAGYITADPALAAAPAYKFLLGRTGEAAGDLLQTYDNYLAAANGNDLWAHRARIALVEFGLQNELLSQHEALEMLQAESRVWRGDRHEIRTLNKVTALQLELDDEIAALATLASIATHFPGTPEADIAREQARGLWTGFYENVDTMPLSRLLAGHLRIAADYRFEQGFAAGTEALADRFMAAGATVVAADEYRETRDYLLVGRDLGLLETEDRALDRLRLKQADAFLAGMQTEEAAHVLAADLLTDDVELRDWLNLSRARLSTLHGDPAGVVGTSQTSPSQRFQRLQAAALFERGEWAAAQAAYAALIEKGRDDAPFADAARLLLAAYHAGDETTAIATIQKVPALAARPEWQQITAGMLDAPPPVLPLRAETADARINFAAETLAALRALSEAEVAATPEATPTARP